METTVGSLTFSIIIQHPTLAGSGASRCVRATVNAPPVIWTRPTPQHDASYGHFSAAQVSRRRAFTVRNFSPIASVNSSSARPHFRPAHFLNDTVIDSASSGGSNWKLLPLQNVKRLQSTVQPILARWRQCRFSRPLAYSTTCADECATRAPSRLVAHALGGQTVDAPTRIPAVVPSSSLAERRSRFSNVNPAHCVGFASN